MKPQKQTRKLHLEKTLVRHLTEEGLTLVHAGFYGQPVAKTNPCTDPEINGCF